MASLYGEQKDNGKRKNVMWEEAELPDHDYESIYGHAAMHARLLAQLDALLHRMDVRNASLADLNRRGTAAAQARRPPALPDAGRHSDGTP
jgi:hypothetical protein